MPVKLAVANTVGAAAGTGGEWSISGMEEAGEEGQRRTIDADLETRGDDCGTECEIESVGRTRGEVGRRLSK